MKIRPFIHLPNFAKPYFYQRVVCAKCGMQNSDDRIIAAGAMRELNGALCFGYEFNCRFCKKTTTILDTTRRFSRQDWWVELAAWHDAAPNMNDVSMLANVARRKLPKIGPMIVGPHPHLKLWVRGGYKGEVGPIMLIYEGMEEDPISGVLRLEKNDGVSLFDHGVPDCLARSDFHRFVNTPDGDDFRLDEKKWIRMSSSEIGEIVRDRVFTLSMPEQPVTRRPRKAPSGHGSTDAPKSSKGSRRSSHDAGKVDSRRRRA